MVSVTVGSKWLCKAWLLHTLGCLLIVATIPKVWPILLFVGKDSCKGGNNGGCGNRHCTDTHSGPKCSCSTYYRDINKTIAEGKNIDLLIISFRLLCNSIDVVVIE